MSSRYAARIVRLAAGVLLLLAAGRLLFVYLTGELVAYSRYVKQPEIYLSPWPDIARFSAIALASVPLVILCSIRLIRRATRKSDRSPSSFSFAADCGGLYCFLSLLQYLIYPNFFDPTPKASLGFLQNLNDGLLLSNFGGALGAYSGLVVGALLLAPADPCRALLDIGVAAILSYVVFAYALARFDPLNPDINFWFWILIPPVSAFVGATIFRLSNKRVISSSEAR
jgi:hypothetical protein